MFLTVICSDRVRLVYKRITERAIPHLIVLAYSEILPTYQVERLGIISFAPSESKEAAETEIKK